MFVLTTISSHGRRLVTLRPRAMQGPCSESRQPQERLGCQASLLYLFSRRLGKGHNRDRRGPECALLSDVWKNEHGRCVCLCVCGRVRLRSVLTVHPFWQPSSASRRHAQHAIYPRDSLCGTFHRRKQIHGFHSPTSRTENPPADEAANSEQQ